MMEGRSITGHSFGSLDVLMRGPTHTTRAYVWLINCVVYKEGTQ